MRSGVSSVIVVPATALDSMNLGALSGLSNHAQTLAGDGQPPIPRPNP
jgi:hypothetical protein